jgi:hypothetical protein
MTPQQQRIAIAEACGYEFKTHEGKSYCFFEELDGWVYWENIIPHYLNDLNAMHEAIGTLLFSQRRAYRINLKEIMSKKINPAVICYSECIDAPAAQRAEAFLRTINKWTTNPNEL